MNYTLIKPNLRSMWVHSATFSCINELHEKWYTLAVFAKLEFSRGFLYISLISPKGSAKLRYAENIIFLGCRLAHLGEA
jgi:hypothetical protein